MTLKITLCTDNAAFEEGGIATETGRILRKLAERIEDGELPAMILRDINGNAVGSVESEN